MLNRLKENCYKKGWNDALSLIKTFALANIHFIDELWIEYVAAQERNNTIKRNMLIFIINIFDQVKSWFLQHIM